MDLWNDPAGWAALCSGATCPICLRREPRDIVAKLEASWVTMQEAAPIRGYVCLVSQIHAVELHDLPNATATAFMRDARRVSKALAAASGAVKLNYEFMGTRCRICTCTSFLDTGVTNLKGNQSIPGWSRIRSILQANSNECAMLSWRRSTRTTHNRRVTYLGEALAVQSPPSIALPYVACYPRLVSGRRYGENRTSKARDSRKAGSG